MDYTKICSHNLIGSRYDVITLVKRTYKQCTGTTKYGLCNRKPSMKKMATIFGIQRLTLSGEGGGLEDALSNEYGWLP